MTSNPLPAATASPEQRGILTVLGKKLLVAWGCSVIWELGSLLAVFIWVRYAFSGFLFGEAPPGSLLLLLALGLGLMGVAPGAVLLGFSLTRSWRRGVTTGFLAFLAAVIGLGLGWLGWSVTDQLLLVPAISAATVIMTVILTSAEAFPNRYLGLGMGLTVGPGLSLITSLILKRVFGDIDLSPYLQIPPLVWVSAVYFPELVAGRSGWKGFLVWALLILATFGLPFVVVPVLARLFG